MKVYCKQGGDTYQGVSALFKDVRSYFASFGSYVQSLMMGCDRLYKYHLKFCAVSQKFKGWFGALKSYSGVLREFPRRSLITRHASVTFISSDVRKHGPQPQGAPWHLSYRAERECPCKCQFAPGLAMTVEMAVLLPPSHSLKQWGTALPERQLG